MTTEAAAAQISVGDLRVENDSLQCLLINFLGVSLWVLSGVVVVVLEARRWPQERQEQQRRAQSSGDGGGGPAVFRRLNSLLTLSAPGLALTLFSLSPPSQASRSRHKGGPCSQGRVKSVVGSRATGRLGSARPRPGRQAGRCWAATSPPVPVGLSAARAYLSFLPLTEPCYHAVVCPHKEQQASARRPHSFGMQSRHAVPPDEGSRGGW